MTPTSSPPTSTPETAPRLSGEQTRLSMRLVIVSWAFGAAFFQLSSGAVYASFARQIGAGESTFGFLAGVTPLLSFLQVPAAWLMETRVSARRMMLGAGVVGRSLWLLAASLPLWHWAGVLPREGLLPGFVACVLGASVAQAFVGPSFYVWMSELVPGRVGPSFWAQRQRVGQIAAIFAVLVGGTIADQAGTFKEMSNGEVTPLIVYSLILVVAAICGLLDVVLFWRVEAPPRAPISPTKTPIWASFRAPLRERTVRRYLLFTATAMIGFGTTGPLLWLYCLEVLDLPKTTTGLLLTVSPLLGMVLTSKTWGAVVRDHGSRPLLRFASVGLLLVPIGWLLVTRDSLVPLAIMLFLSGVLAGAYEICHLNFITRVCPHLPRPPLTAIFAICAGCVFALTAWFAGSLVEVLSGFKQSVGPLVFGPYHVVFLLSLLPRAVAAFWLAPRLQEPEASRTRVVVREVGSAWAQTLSARFSRVYQARGSD